MDRHGAGGRNLLTRAERVVVTYDDRSEVLLRPRLLAAVVGKWRAFSEIAAQPDPDRHLRDAADLLSVVEDPDTVQRDEKERRHLRALYATLRQRPELTGIDRDHVLDTVNLLANGPPPDPARDANPGGS